MTCCASRMAARPGSRCVPWSGCSRFARPQLSSLGSAKRVCDTRAQWAFILQRLKQMPELLDSIHPTGPGHFGVGERGIFALVNPQRLRRILTKMLDENEFLSPYGIRSLSKYHKDHPYILNVGGHEYRVDYLPAESDSGLFGGNSNWRGPYGYRQRTYRSIAVKLLRILRRQFQD